LAYAESSDWQASQSQHDDLLTWYTTGLLRPAQVNRDQMISETMSPSTTGLLLTQHRAATDGKAGRAPFLLTWAHEATASPQACSALIGLLLATGLPLTAEVNAHHLNPSLVKLPPQGCHWHYCFTTGLPLTAEVNAHHLTWADADVPDGATLFKCMPPLRDLGNQEALWQGLQVREFVISPPST
jgi:hypothetical protein